MYNTNPQIARHGFKMQCPSKSRNLVLQITSSNFTLLEASENDVTSRDLRPPTNGTTRKLPLPQQPGNFWKYVEVQISHIKFVHKTSTIISIIQILTRISARFLGFIGNRRQIRMSRQCYHEGEGSETTRKLCDASHMGGASCKLAAIIATADDFLRKRRSVQLDALCLVSKNVPQAHCCRITWLEWRFLWCQQHTFCWYGRFEKIPEI